MENITSIVLNENILVMRSPTNVIRLIRGKVIYLKELKQSLPSTFAASYNSRGMLSIPASVKMHMNGILTQASAIIHPNMANVALEKTGRGLSINPSFIRKSLNTPTSGLNIHFQIKPEITNGTAQGNIASDLNTADPLLILDKSKAKITPPQNVRPVTPVVYTTVFFKLSQKSRSLKI